VRGSQEEARTKEVREYVSEEERRRQEILNTRTEHKRLSEIIVRGTDYHETVKVRGIDGKEYSVDVHAMTDQEFVRACADADIHAPKDGTSVDLGSNMKLLAAIAAVVAQDPKIAEVLAPFETAKIGKRVLEISGLGPDPKPKSASS
jgi:hypothetical protein